MCKICAPTRGNCIGSKYHRPTNGITTSQWTTSVQQQQQKQRDNGGVGGHLGMGGNGGACLQEMKVLDPDSPLLQ